MHKNATFGKCPVTRKTSYIKGENYLSLLNYEKCEDKGHAEFLLKL
jgi:hypothetical protein